MRKNIVTTLVILCSTVSVIGTCASARAEVGQNSIGPSVSIGNGTSSIGIDSKFGVNDNFSIRPFIYFPTGGTDIGSALTYDFHLKNTDSKVQITPFVGGSIDVNSLGGDNNSSVTTVSFVGGADFDVTDSIRLKAAAIVPLSTDRGQTTNITLGAGFRF
jgi:hypothetical protein